MEWIVELDERGRFIRATQWDDFDLDHQAHFLTDIFAGPHWKPGIGILFDYRGLKVTQLSEADLATIRVIFQSVRKRLGVSKLALLCDSDELFEVGKHFGEMIAEKMENQLVIFRDEQAAINWLTA